MYRHFNLSGLLGFSLLIVLLTTSFTTDNVETASSQQPLAQIPNMISGLPAEALVGNQLCFDLTFTNSGSPGYQPYARLILPADSTFDSASLLGRH
ncbi:MAG: hypothetical protein ACI85U_003577, partial [Candidatus Promineifilaceae bacterium]